MGRRKKRLQSLQMLSKSSSDRGITEEKHVAFVKCVNDQLQALNLCSSGDEYSSVAEAIAESVTANNTPSEDDLQNATTSLLDFFNGVQQDDAKKIVYSAAAKVWGTDLNHITLLSNDINESNCVESCIDNDDYRNIGNDGDFIREGECELCERNVKLTRHHLIPKSTWPRMKKRLWNVADAIESLNIMLSDKKRANFTQHQQSLVDERKKILQCKLGTSDLSSLPVTITHESVRAHLCQVCLLCRMCHSAVHRIHSEWQLATEYNTIDRLLECEEVLKFARWANKQRPRNNLNDI